MVPLDLVRELRPLEPVGGGGQTRRQLVEVRHHEPGDTAEDLRRGSREVKLRVAEVAPHVVEPDHQVGIPGPAERDDVELGRELLIGDADVDVLEVDDVAEVFQRAVEGLTGHGSPPARIVPHPGRGGR